MWIRAKKKHQHTSLCFATGAIRTGTMLGQRPLRHKRY
jgi:hypothetical protein